MAAHHLFGQCDTCARQGNLAALAPLDVAFLLKLANGVGHGGRLHPHPSR